MTSMSEPIGGAEWVRQVNKRLGQLERIPHTTGGEGATAATPATVSARTLNTTTSVSFEADVLQSSGERSDTSMSPDTLFDITFDPNSDTEIDPYVVEDYGDEDYGGEDDAEPPVEARTDLQYAPPAPSDPIVESRATGVAVIWDGLGAGNEAIPVNLLLVEVHRSLEGPVFEPDELTYAGSFLDAGLIVFSDQEYEIPWWYRLVLVTNDGRRSTPTNGVEGIAHKLQVGEVGFSASEIDFDGVIADAVGTAEDALASANGKNAVTHSLLAPVAEANTANDIWFQHAPAAEGGAIIGQWTGLGGTAWEATTLSHQVISSVDLGTATVGKLSANFIESGLLSAEITVTGTLMAGDPLGARVIMDEAGIRQYATATALRINFPTNGDPAQFEGSVQADSMTVKGSFTMQGTDNFVARAAEFRVAAGTATPTSPVTLAVGYETYDTGRWVAGGLFAPVGVHGNIDDTPDVYASSGFYGYGKMWGPTNRVYNFPAVVDNAGNNRSTYGLGSSSTMIHTTAGAERMVTMGSRCLTNGATPAGSIDTWDVSTMNSGGTGVPVLKAHLNAKEDDYVWQTRLGRVFSTSSPSTVKPRFACAQQRFLTDDIRLTIFEATDSTMTQIGSDVIVADPFASGETIIGVNYGSSAKMLFPGSDVNVWLVHGSVKTYAYNAAGTTRLTDLDFPTPAGMVRMSAWGDVATNQFLGFRATAWSETTPVTKLTNNHWATGTSDKWWVSSTWYDADGTGGLHETTQGVRSSIIMKKRAGLSFTIPTYPDRPFPTTTDDPTSARVYLGRGVSDPTRPNMERVTTLASPTRSGYVGTFAFPAGAAANPPPVGGGATDFPNTAAGKFSSADGTGWVFVGDGTATLAGVGFDGAHPGMTSAAMRPVTGSSGSSTTYTSTSYVDHTSGPNVVFTVPASGNVVIYLTAFLKTDTSPGVQAEAAIELRTGSSRSGGSVVSTGSALDNYNVEWIRATGVVGLYTGLVPGDTYCAHPVVKTNNAASGAAISVTTITVMPTF